jgi:hypothetical protein
MKRPDEVQRKQCAMSADPQARHKPNQISGL